MQKLYFSQGSKSEAEGLTVHFATFDDDGAFMVGLETGLTTANRKNGKPTSVDEYVGSLYKGKKITEKQYKALLFDASPRGLAGGVLNKTGKKDMDKKVKVKDG